MFGLGLRDSCLVILFFNLLCCALPAYLCVHSPILTLLISKYLLLQYDMGTKIRLASDGASPIQFWVRTNSCPYHFC